MLIAGGGLDIHAGLPLAFALRDVGIEVALANLSSRSSSGHNFTKSAVAELIRPGKAW